MVIKKTDIRKIISNFKVNNNNKGITWGQLDRWIPIIITCMAVAITWANLGARIDLLTQKVDALIKNQETIISKYEKVQTRLGKDELALKAIITKLDINLIIGGE